MYVQRQLGHAQITTTERLYGHLEESFVRRAAAATERAILAAPAGRTGRWRPCQRDATNPNGRSLVHTRQRKEHA